MTISHMLQKSTLEFNSDSTQQTLPVSASVSAPLSAPVPAKLAPLQRKHVQSVMTDRELERKLENYNSGVFLPPGKR